MFKQCSVSFYLKLILLLFFIAFAFGSEVYERVQMENILTDQIKRDLSGLLLKDQYAVFSSVSLSKKREREVDFVEKNTYKETPYEKQGSRTPSSTQSPSPTLELPGFGSYNANPTPTQQSRVIQQEDIFEKLVEKEESQERYRYTDNVQVERVHVDIIIDKSVEDEKRRSIEFSLRKKLDTSYPGRSSLSFQVADLTQKVEKALEEKSDSTPTDFINKNFPLLALLSPFFFLLLLVTLVILALMIKMLFFNRERRPEYRQKENKEDSPSPSIAPQANAFSQQPFSGESPKIKAKDNSQEENKFIQEFIQDPLIARQYFYNLSPAERADLIDALDSPNVKKSIQSLVDEDLPKSEVLDGLEGDERITKKKEILEAKRKDLQNYKRISNIQLTETIGKMNLLTEQEVNQLLSRLSMEDLAYLLPYIENERTKKYIQGIDEEDKQELLKHLMEVNREGVSEDRLKKLSEGFTKEIETMAKNIFVDTGTRDSISEMILEESKESKQLVNDIGKSNERFLRKYKHYTYDQDDLVSEDQDGFQRFFEGVENDTIAIASFVMDPPLKEKIKENVTPQRMEFIQSIINARRNGLKRSEAEEAYRQLINQYRFQKSNEISATEF